MTRVLIVSENISLNMGGESSLPFYYAKLLSERGVEVWLACHDRVRRELEEKLPEFAARTFFIADTRMQKGLYHFGEKLNSRIKVAFTEQAIHLITQFEIRKIARRLAAEGKIDVVFEPAPITPKGLSFMYDIGVPVVIGPLCGGMSFPPAFRDMDSVLANTLMRAGRRAGEKMHRVAPGKLFADVIMVANMRTQEALPQGVRGRVVQLYESGVDLDLWQPQEDDRDASDEIVRFAYSGSFIDLKGIRFLVDAFVKVVAEAPWTRLHLVGGGPLEPVLKAQIAEAGIDDKVHFHGWIARPEAAKIIRKSDIFVMPSLRECGGTAVLEALALGKPVIATKWGGPSEYVDDRCGVLVEPSSKQGFIDGLAEAMLRLARSPELRQSLGEGGKARVREDYLAWDAKADRVLELINQAVLERKKTA